MLLVLFPLLGDHDNLTLKFHQKVDTLKKDGSYR